MSEVGPIRERELLIDDDVRQEMRRAIDPLINHVLSTRGYSEERTPSGRVHLDASTLQASDSYQSHFGKSPFDGLAVRTAHDVYDGERFLTGARIDLARIGGFSVSQILKANGAYYTKTIKADDGSKKTPYTQVETLPVQEILQDIRAHTALGYSNSDILIDADRVVEELEGLHSTRSIDRRASFEMDTSEEHGLIQFYVGESFELRETKSGTRVQNRRFNSKKVFEIIATQPLREGTVTLGVHYRSKGKNPEMKITTEINGTDYSEDEVEYLYKQALNSYQEKDVRRFGKGVIANLTKIADTDSNILRLS